MASLFKNRIEDYIGSYRGNIEQIDWLNALSSWLTDSAKELFEIAPIVKLKMQSNPIGVVPVVDTDNEIYGFEAIGKRIISVNKDGYPCVEIDDSVISKYQDTDSLFYATPKSPVFYMREGYLKILPDSTISRKGSVTGVTVDDAGSEYLDPPSVTISGGGGSGATAVAVLKNDFVLYVDVTNGGAGYTGTPTVTIQAPEGGGSTATAHAVVESSSISGQVNYAEAPSVDWDSVSIDYFPSEFETAVIIGASIKAKMRQIVEKRSDLPSLLTDEDLAGLSYTVSTLSLSTHLSTLNTYVETEEDSEMVSAKIAEINAIMQEKIVDLSQEEKAQAFELQRVIQKFTNNFQSVTGEIQLMNAELQALQMQYQQSLQIAGIVAQSNARDKVEE